MRWVGALALALGFWLVVLWPLPEWSEADLAAIRGMRLGSLGPVPVDPSNRFADDPAAAALGARLFADPRLSGDGTVACASCHVPAKQFQDGLPLGRGVGTTTRRTQSIAGAAHARWQFWDGRKDSLWAQALGPLESPVEHGGTRTQYARVVRDHYRSEYETLFGPLPGMDDRARFPAAAGPVEDPAARAAWEAMRPADREAVTRVYVNVGKAIAAFERGVVHAPSRFDAYAEALARGEATDALSAAERRGLRIFLGRGRCAECHAGPRLTNGEFHNVGTPPRPGLPLDEGRRGGAAKVTADEFNCLSEHSDAPASACGELRFMKRDDPKLAGAFKVPSLRGVAERAPYMHAGQFATLAEVIEHYDRAPAAAIGRSELVPLGLTAAERRDLEAFLGTLSG